MLNKSDTINGNAIENIVCKAIEESPREEMDKDLTDTFIMLMMAKNKKFEIPEKEKPFIYKMIEKRIKGCHTFKTNDNRLIMFLSALAISPGNAVLYLWYLQYWAKKNNVREIDFDIFAMRIFPHGFPTEASMHKIWDSQKVDYSNARKENDLMEKIDTYNERPRVQKPRKYWRLLRNLKKKPQNRFGSDNLVDYNNAGSSIHFMN